LEATYKLSLIETPVNEEGSIVAQTREAPAAAVPMAKLKRGVGNPNGVPEVSHVVSNVAETDVVSKEHDFICVGLANWWSFHGPYPSFLHGSIPSRILYTWLE
jgi:hypothetical protein